MGKLFLAGIGGFIGSALRYGLTGIVHQWSRRDDLPIGTLAVNLIGCFAIGFLSELSEQHGMFTGETRTLVFVGVIGGFTTFSAFGNETVNLWRGGHHLIAGLNIVAQLVLGLAAVLVSRVLASQLGR